MAVISLEYGEVVVAPGRVEELSPCKSRLEYFLVIPEGRAEVRPVPVGFGVYLLKIN